MFSKKSSGTQIYRTQEKITRLRLRIEKLQDKRRGHIQKVAEIDREIQNIHQQIESLKNQR